MPKADAIEPSTAPEPSIASRRITELEVSGMTCGNCARHVTQALQNVPGVRSAQASLEAHQATIWWGRDAQPDPQALIHAVEEEGYGAKVIEHGEADQRADSLAGWKLNLWLGIPATALLMLGEWGFGFAMAPWFQWLSFVFAAIVQVFAGARFYRGAWNQLKAGNSNMDTLVALGSSTAFGYSTWALLAHQHSHVYFMEAVAIITLISSGHWMESRVSLRASSALRKLLNLAPPLARRLNPDGTEQEVSLADLSVGQNVVLRPGDRMPTDGQVVEGSSALDESMLTGESVPVDKSAGSEVYAGTVNLNGRLVVRVTATGAETALAQIISAVQRAQNSRAEIQRLGDRVSSVFVPIVIALAAAAGLWWGLAPESAASVHRWLAQFLWLAQAPSGQLAAAFITAAAVLIIACPCAMGLATPAAIMAGSNVAAQRGILIRDGVALEKAGGVTAVLFDKTGTLTAGRPNVVQFREFELPHELRSTPGIEPFSALGLAAALARHSTHPLSRAVAQTAESQIEFFEWQEVRGAGVEGKLRPNNGSATIARLGSLTWLNELGVALDAGKDFVANWSAQGATILGSALDDSLIALFAVRDTLKAGVPGVINQLQRQGLQTWLVTGDNRLTAEAIAAQAGIPAENVFAQVRPENKAALVQKLQSQGERVAFVGDGINDAPALEQANLGIAVCRASDIAREAADIILLKSEIEAVPESLGLARATLRTIKQNLFWAFFYNAVGIPLAALGFMSPILCAAAMGLSDLVVIGNALRLRSWRLRQ